MIDDYVVTDAMGNIEKILCKGCGAPLWSPSPYGNARTRKLPDGRIIEERPYMVRPTAEYMDLKIEMVEQRGDEAITHYHVTSVCRSCFHKLRTQDLQALFRIDMRQLSREGVKDVPKWMHRRAVRIVASGDLRNPVV